MRFAGSGYGQSKATENRLFPLSEYWYESDATEADIYANNFSFKKGFNKDFTSDIICMIHMESNGNAKVARYNSTTFEQQVPGLNDHVFDIFSIARKELEATQNK
jgi:hypothetical protein